ncbi:MAG: TetR/AcrR family transcriptional regulator [Actinomycetota bacterium]
MPRPSRRQDVLEAASARFFRDGISATGVDAIIEDAGVAKMTLYRHFPSKDDLVVAYLTRRDADFRERLEAELSRRRDPWQRALAPADLYRATAEEPGFHGCAFVNAGAELAEDHPGHGVIAAHKRWVVDRWATLLAELGVADPGALAEECALLAEGGLAQAGVGLGAERLDAARERIAARLGAAVDRAAAASASGEAGRGHEVAGAGGDERERA